jgi:crotonobetainyl-CoA:carnitine CoA-transferase CaiB-like acyl-CoA transferase
MSRTPSQIAAPPPLAGGDADNILKSLGYNDSDIDKLRASKAI